MYSHSSSKSNNSVFSDASDDQFVGQVETIPSFKYQSTIDDPEKYFELVNRDNLDFIEDQQLTFLKMNLASILHNDKSKLAIYLRSLADQEKIDLMIALILNDQGTFTKILLPQLNHTDSSLLKHLPKITEHKHCEQEVFFSETTADIIKVMLTKNKHEALEEIYIKRILAAVMENILDTTLSLPVKKLMFEELMFALIPDYEEEYAISVSYKDHLPPLKNNKFNGKITLDEYKSIVNASVLTHSEFILLTTGLLESAHAQDTQVSQLLTVIREAYHLSKYDEALLMLKDLCQLSTIQQDIAGVILKQLKNTSSSIKEDDMHINDGRRFFENRLVQLYFGHFNGFTRVNKIFKHFLSNEVKSIQELHACLRALFLVQNKSLAIRFDELKEASPNYQIRGRCFKDNFEPKHDEADGEETDAIFSRNLGILRSLSPNFYDELSELEMRNRTVDINTAINEPGTYENKKSRSAFVASMSGHAFYVITILEVYMRSNQKDPDLQKDINNIINAYIYSYIAQGFHSLPEMLDAFNEQHVKDLFAAYNVVLDFSLPDTMLQSAFLDAQEYTKRICFKQCANNEFRASLFKYRFFAQDDKEQCNDPIFVAFKSSQL